MHHVYPWNPSRLMTRYSWTMRSEWSQDGSSPFQFETDAVNPYSFGQTEWGPAMTSRQATFSTTLIGHTSTRYPQNVISLNELPDCIRKGALRQGRSFPDSHGPAASGNPSSRKYTPETCHLPIVLSLCKVQAGERILRPDTILGSEINCSTLLTPQCLWKVNKETELFLKVPSPRPLFHSSWKVTMAPQLNSPGEYVLIRTKDELERYQRILSILPR